MSKLIVLVLLVVGVMGWLADANVPGWGWLWLLVPAAVIALRG